MCQCVCAEGALVQGEVQLAPPGRKAPGQGAVVSRAPLRETNRLLTSSPMLTAARASMAVSSGSGAAVASTPEGAAPPHFHPQRT